MKTHLLLLHGAIGGQHQLQPLADLLQHEFHTHLLNFYGHGGNMMDVPFSIETFADQTATYIKENKLAPVVIFGYSMGGYVAMYLAANQPDLVAGVCTLATKYLWNTEVAAKEVKMLDAGKIEAKLPAFAATLLQRHSPGTWKTVLQKTAAMLMEMGSQNPLKTDQYAAIQQPVLVMLGDRDKMLSIEETVDVFKALPNAQLAILPNTLHPIEQVDIAQLQFQLTKFFKSIDQGLVNYFGD